MLYNYGMIFLFIIFVNNVLSFGLVGLWTIRLSACAGAHIGYSSRSRAEDMTITNVIIKPQIGNGTAVWMTSCPEAMGWKFGNFEKDVSWDLILGEASPAGGYGIRSAFVGSESWDVTLGRAVQRLVEILTLGRAVQQGVGCGRCMNSQYSKNCVSLSSCRKTKLKKSINVSYRNNESLQCFRISLHQYILHIVTLVLCFTYIIREN